MEIIVKTQAELDAALVAETAEHCCIKIHGGTKYDRLVVRARPKNGCVQARESSHVEARESSSVVAWESSHVEARESSSVVAWESSHVEAWESSHVEARESSSVVAWESSHVEAWESSHVEARGSSSVVAKGAAAVHVHSAGSKVSLLGFAVAILVEQAAKVLKKAKTATVVRPKVATGVAGWLEGQGLAAEKSAIVLYKRVSAAWKTQENTANETDWAPGAAPVHPAWAPTSGECGAGKYHGCSRAYFCDEFRSARGDRYVAIHVLVKDLHVWPNASYPHKCAFRSGVVLHECNRLGRKIDDKKTVA